jgi:hypothetical protein
MLIYKLLYQSHTGSTLAWEFHSMLVKHGLDQGVPRATDVRRLIIIPQILTFNADNVSNNDTQTDKLDDLPNSFEHINRIRCFNHTKQISARGLLEPLTAAKPVNEGIDVDDGDMAGINNPDDMIGSDDEDEDARLDGGVNENDDDGDLMDGLDDDEKEDLIDSTKEAAEALQKVRQLTSMETAANNWCSSVAQPCFRSCAFDHEGASCLA